MNSNKLILLNIFSYSCMNCLRSLKFIKKIDEKYKKFGLDTILIHTPEWEFEKNKENILWAFKKYKINSPIIIDKDRKIIKRLGIDFWPAQILIKNREVIYRHVGEGNYKELEDKIIKLVRIKSKPIFDKEPKYSKFPVFYCGRGKNGKMLNLKNKLRFGIVYTKGKWVQKNEFLQNIRKKGSLTILTKGKVINFVAKSINKTPIKINVKLNDKFIKKISINRPQLYNIIKLNNNKQNKLTITTKSNFAVYLFSFQ